MQLKAHRRAAEPDYDTACRWWPDQTGIWTPVGWKDHLFRFSVLFNGTVVAQPDLNARTGRWKGQGAQYAFFHSFDGQVPDPKKQLTYLKRDDGMVRQGWREDVAPVLWTEWSQDGLLLRQKLFAHIPGGRPTVTGVEPLFLWVRLSVHYACRALPLEPKAGFLIAIQAPHLATTMSAGRNLVWLDERAAYPRKLFAERRGYSRRAGFHVTEKDGRVRLAVAPGQDCRAELHATTDSSEVLMLGEERITRQALPPNPQLYVQMDARAGARADLLLTMLPVERKLFDRELAQGYDAARRQANRFWTAKPPTAARVSVPERPITEMIPRLLQFAEVVAERNPADGRVTMLTGSLSYSKVWATCNSIALIMTLDTLGYHSVVEKYLRLFNENQGRGAPPGDAFARHPGYLSVPDNLRSVDWLSDHGALLWAACEHALLTDDPRFVESWLEPILKACEFIRDARRIAGHGGVPGLMPPAQASDRTTRIQAVWNDGWNHKGLVTAVRLLRRLGHPRAAEFEEEALDYRNTFRRAFLSKVRTMRRWTDARGCKHPILPTSLHGDSPEETRHAFYLDTGPLSLVFLGLFDANEELMADARLWFREGPPLKLARPDSNCWQVPHLRHEMSSCEPCYSWNVFHSWQLNDRARFLEGLYSLLTGAVSRKTFSPCETRSARLGVNVWQPSVYLARLSVMDDAICENELHLLRLVPLAWISREAETQFEVMPTEYGPVTLRFRLARDRKSLHVQFRPRFRRAPKRIVLHVPPLPGLVSLIVNGVRRKLDGARRVELRLGRAAWTPVFPEGGDA